MGPEIATGYVMLRPKTVGNFGQELTSQVSKGVDTSAKKTGSRFGGLFKSTAARMLGAAGGLFAAQQVFSFFKDSIKAAEESEAVARKTEAIIKATGGVAGITAGHVTKLTSSLQAKTAVDDEVIRSGSNILLTFKGIRNEAGEGNKIFDRANAIMLDLAATTGQSVPGAATMLGKALQDPIKGMTAMRRVGVSFTEQQEEQVSKMVESGNTLGAQRLIMKELESQYGGTAEAGASASDKLRVGWGEFQEQVGSAILPLWNKIVDVIVQRVLPAVSNFVSAIGPGFQKVSSIIGPVFQTIFGLFNGFGDRLSATQSRTSKFAEFISSVWDSIRTSTKAIWDIITAIITAAVNLVSGVWQRSGTKILAAVKGIWDGIRQVIQGGLRAISGLLEVFAGILTLDWKRAWNGLKDVLGGIWQALKGVVKIGINQIKLQISVAMGIVQSLWSGIWTRISDEVKGAWNRIVKFVGTFGKGIVRAIKAIASPWIAAWKVLINIVKTVWNTISKLVSIAWREISKNVSERLTKLRTNIKDRLEAIKKNWTAIWNAVVKFATETWNKIRANITERIEKTRENIKNKLATIKKNWEAIWKAVRTFAGEQWGKIRDNIRDRIEGIRKNLAEKIATIRKNWNEVWTAIKDRAQEIWSKVTASGRNFRDTMGNIFKSVANVLRNPINWVINNVINKLIGGWNRLNNLWGGGDISPVASLPRFRTGGRVPGSGDKDTVPALLTPGEYIMNKSAVRRLGVQYLNFLNSGQRENTDEAKERIGYQTGGLVGAIRGAAALVKRLGYSIISGYRPGARTLSGSLSYHARGMAIDVTPSMRLFNILRSTFPNATELIFTPAGRKQLWHGMSHLFSPGVAAQHYSHIHLALAGGIGRALFALTRKAALAMARSSVGKVIQSFFGNITGKIATFAKGTGLVGGMAGKLFRLGLGKLKDVAIDKLADFLFRNPPAGSAPGAFKGPIVQVVKAVAQGYGWHTGAQWNALANIIQRESGWRPRAQNPTSSAYGLFQFLDSTWASTGIRKTSNPRLQAMAGLRYIRSRYGTPVGAWRHWQNFNWYDNGGLLPTGISTNINTTGKPEVVAAEGMIYKEVVSALRDIGGMRKGQTVNVVIPDLGITLQGYVDNRIRRSNKQQVISMRK